MTTVSRLLLAWFACMPDSAFVICQIGPEGSDIRSRADEIFEFVVKPVAEEFDLNPKRSDMDPAPGQITAQIVESVTSAKVVIADLTGRNPNVFYELGVAHSFGIPVVSLIDSTDNIPFDTANERVIVIGDSGTLGAREAAKATERLREALKIVLKPGYKPVSIVTEAAQARSIDALAPDNPIASEIADMRGLLEQVVKHTAEIATFRASNNFMFDLLQRLAEKKYIHRGHVMAVGMDLADAPKDGRVDLSEALSGIIPPPPPKPKPKPPADDDIPDFAPKAGRPAPADDDIPF